MVSVSTLISELDGVTGARFVNSLAIVNNYAKKDTAMNVSPLFLLTLSLSSSLWCPNCLV